MKKALVLILAALMLLSMVPAVASAEDLTGDGPWITLYDAANAEKHVGNNKDKDGKILPLAGYKFDEKGFHVISPTYTSAPFTAATAWQPLDLSKVNDVQGNHVLSAQFTIDQFGYKGENGDKDEWFCLSIADKQASTPGAAKYQDGIFLLLRGSGDGNVRVDTYYDVAGSFDNKNVKSGIEVPKDENGKEVYTFTVDLVEGSYVLKLNDVDITLGADATVGGKNLNQILDTFKDKAYFQITAQTGYLSDDMNKIEFTVNNYNGLVPMGNESKDPVSNVTKKADVADPSTVEKNKPALEWNSNSTFEGGYAFKKNEDGTVHVTNTGNYFMWTVPDDQSYSAGDFGWVCVLAKATDSASISPLIGTTYYCSDDVLTPDDSHTDGSSYDTELGEGWVFTVLDGLAYKWDGRINALRIHFKPTEFDLAWIGCFRSEAEGMAYAIDYLKAKGLEVTAPPETTKKPKTTKAPVETTSPATTNAPAETTGAEEKKSSCNGMISMIAIVPVIATAVVFKKKHD